jgi:predicted transcriptional regulator
MSTVYELRHLLPIDLDDEQLERLEQLAESQGHPVEEIISEAIARYSIREANSDNYSLQ